MKKIIFILLIIIPINIYALTYPNLHYENALVYDLTDKKILFEKEIEEEKSIASLTKLITIITALESNDNLKQEIKYTSQMAQHVPWYASVAGFKVGEKLTYEDLLYAAMLPSGADATIALALTTTQSVDDFLKQMNALAKKIGMNNSNFVNVHGLDEENHYSTVKDIKKLLEYALKNEKFKKIYTTKEYTLSNGKKIKSTVLKQGIKYNLNTEKILGSKTGFTANAGLCISALMEDDNHEILIITLDAPSTKGIPYNVKDALELINFIEKNYNIETIIEPNQIIEELKVKNSKIAKYKIKSNKKISLYLEKDYNKNDIKIEYIGNKDLSYKNKINDKLGIINYFYNDKLIESETVYLKENILVDYIKIAKENKNNIFLIIMVIAIFKISLKVLKRTSKR